MRIPKGLVDGGWQFPGAGAEVDAREGLALGGLEGLQEEERKADLMVRRYTDEEEKARMTSEP